LSSSTGAKRALEAAAPGSAADQETILAAEGVVLTDPRDLVDPAAFEPAQNEFLTAQTYRDILKATRIWILYGTGGFAVLCIIVGAFEALFGR
jgi:hypothetical protein